MAFATATRLPAPIHALSSRGSQQARPIARRLGPGTARRLLQPTQPASTSAESSDLRPVWDDPSYGRLRAPSFESPASLSLCRRARTSLGARLVVVCLAQPPLPVVTPDRHTPHKSTVGTVSSALDRPCDPPGPDDGHQPSVHRSGAGRLSPPGASRSPRHLWSGRISRYDTESFAPTRSARTPLVVRSRQPRAETRWRPGAGPAREQRC
jgi:hypothetical protein